MYTTTKTVGRAFERHYTKGRLDSQNRIIGYRININRVELEAQPEHKNWGYPYEPGIWFFGYAQPTRDCASFGNGGKMIVGKTFEDVFNRAEKRKIKYLK